MPKSPNLDSTQPMRLFGQAATPPKYTNRTTNKFSLDSFCGGALGNQSYPGLIQICRVRDCPEDLEKKFNSGANRTDIPSQYGPPSVDKSLGPLRFSTASEIFSWMRNKGESLFRKDS